MSQLHYAVLEQDEEKATDLQEAAENGLRPITDYLNNAIKALKSKGEINLMWEK